MVGRGAEFRVYGLGGLGFRGWVEGATECAQREAGLDPRDKQVNLNPRP